MTKHPGTDSGRSRSFLHFPRDARQTLKWPAGDFSSLQIAQLTRHGSALQRVTVWSGEVKEQRTEKLR